MAIIKPFDKLGGIVVSGTHSLPNRYGLIKFGWSKFGINDPTAGVYRRDYRETGQIFIQKKHAWPINTISPALQANRDKFAAGMVAWHALSDSERTAYDALHSPPNMSGLNRFMRLWLKA